LPRWDQIDLLDGPFRPKWVSIPPAAEPDPAQSICTAEAAGSASCAALGVSLKLGRSVGVVEDRGDDVAAVNAVQVGDGDEIVGRKCADLEGRGVTAGVLLDLSSGVRRPVHQNGRR